MKILFITATRLGDAVLSLGLLDHAVRTWPEARLTIVCGSLPAPLFEAVPGLEALIVLRKRSYNRHWVDLWAKVRGTKWDIVIDLRNSVVSRLIPAGKRFIHSALINAKRHKVEQNAEIMRLNEAPAPRLWLSDAVRAQAAELFSDGRPVLGIGPTANWPAKTWPPECFIALVHQIIKPDGVLPFARVAVFAAENEEHLARPVADAIPPALLIDLIGKTDIALAAALLERCSLYVGNDSGLMHTAAAAGTPTIGLFGPGHPEIYRPWGKHAIYVCTPEPCARLTGYKGFDPATAPCLMTTLTVDTVVEEIKRFWPDARRVGG
jgi:heptosyltransferase III